MVYLDSNDNQIAEVNEDGTYQITMEFPDEGRSSQGFFYIMTCNPKLIKTGNCVDKDIVEQTFEENAYYITLSLNLSYINPNNFEVSYAQQFNWIGFENGYIHSQTVTLGASIFEMQKPSVIQSKERYYGFTQASSFIETGTERYGIQQFTGEPGGIKPYGHIYIYQFFSLNYVCDLVRIQYPPIQTVIGNIGAIAGILLYIQYVIMFYNLRKAEEWMTDYIISKLFPQYQQIKVQRRFKKISKVQFQDREIDKEKYIQFYKKMRHKIEKYQALPHIILNQIEFHIFMKQHHPNYQYISSELDQLFGTEGLFNTDGEINHLPLTVAPETDNHPIT